MMVDDETPTKPNSARNVKRQTVNNQFNHITRHISNNK